MDVLREGALLLDVENLDSSSRASLDLMDGSHEHTHRRSSTKLNGDLSPAHSTVTESTQAGVCLSICYIILYSICCLFIVNAQKMHQPIQSITFWNGQWILT